MLKKMNIFAAILCTCCFAPIGWAQDTGKLFFQGTLGGKPIWINVQAATIETESGQALSGDLSGVYGYGLYDGRDIYLSGKVDEGGAFNVSEQDAQGKKTASWTGQIDLDLGTLQGNWHNAKNTKSLPINTRLVGMSESISISQAVPRDPDNGINAFQTAASSLTLPYFIDPSDQSLNTAINQTMVDFAKKSLTDKSGFSSETNEVRALTPTFAVIVNRNYGYGFGAAHGGSSSHHRVFTRANALQAWRKLTFADIEGGNPQQCLPQLRAQMITALQKDGASSPEQLEAKEIPSLDFLPTQEGVHFYFGEYSVGSYAEGAHQIYLRYSQTAGCLHKPANYPAQ